MHRSLAVVCWFALVACRTSPAVEQPAAAPVDLAGLADAIDPGELPPLTAGMPPWPGVAVAGARAGAVAARDPAQLAGELARVVRTITAAGQLSPVNLGGLLTGIVALAQVEADPACGLACLAATAAAYAALDVPTLGDPDGVMAELIDVGVQAMVAQGADAAPLIAVVDFMRAVIRGAPAHQRRVAARVLRLAPASAEATQVLRDLGRSIGRGGDTGRALELARLVAERGAPAPFADVREVGRACRQHLQVDCAVTWHARATALAAGDEQRAAVARDAEDLIRLRRVVAIGPGAALAPALERAHLLIGLDLTGLATTEFERLRAAHPDDARPVVGLVRASFDQARSRQTAALVAEARRLNHHDREFHELALGMFFTRFMGELLPQAFAAPDGLPALLASFLPQLGEDVAGLARFAPARAAVLGIVIDKSRTFLPLVALPTADQHRRFTELARAALTEVRALRVRYPDEADVYRLALIMTRFGGSARGDYTVVTDPAPDAGPERGPLAVMRATLFVSLIVAWDDASQLGALDAVVATLAGDPALQDRLDALRADLIALRASFGDAAAWAPAAAAYRAQLAHAAPDDRGRLHNNLGVALWRQGAQAEAIAAWAAAVDAGDPVSVARLNLAATAPVTADVLAGLAGLGQHAERGSTRYQALRWHAARSGLTGPGLAAATAEAEAALAASGFGITVSGERGVILDEALNFGLGYSSLRGLLTNFALTSTVWLVLPAP